MAAVDGRSDAGARVRGMHRDFTGGGGRLCIQQSRSEERLQGQQRIASDGYGHHNNNESVQRNGSAGRCEASVGKACEEAATDGLIGTCWQAALVGRWCSATALSARSPAQK